MLILVASLIQHTVCAMYVLSRVLVVSYDALLPTITGQSYCFVAFNAFKFEMYYMTVGSFGLSLFRILYLKEEGWVKYGIGERRLFKVILFGGVGIAVLLATLGRGTTNFHIFVDQNCATPGPIFFEILNAYGKSKGNNFEPMGSLTQKIAILALMAMTTTEMLIYTTFFYHVYQHDNHQRIVRLLEGGVIHARNRNNAISFFGQFYVFISEIGIWIFIMILVSGGQTALDMRVLFPVFRPIAFALMSTIEVLTSNMLRPRIIKLW